MNFAMFIRQYKDYYVTILLITVPLCAGVFCVLLVAYFPFRFVTVMSVFPIVRLLLVVAFVLRL